MVAKSHGWRHSTPKQSAWIGRSVQERGGAPLCGADSGLAPAPLCFAPQCGPVLALEGEDLGISGVGVAPADVGADRPGHFGVALVVRVGDGEFAERPEVGLDGVGPRAIGGCEGQFDGVVRAPLADHGSSVVVQVVQDHVDGLAVGEQVYAIGNPYGLSGSLTVGIISQLGRTIQDPVAGNFSVAGAIQFSAPINPGNSGGPLLDSRGQVIGITTATVTSSQGIGFAIPSVAIIRDLPSLTATGTYSRYSFMGINTVDMNYQLAQASGTNVTYGVLVESVMAGSPAARAGLRAGTTLVMIDGSQYSVGGDIIISVNGTKIINQDALSTYLAQNTTAGETVTLGVIRSGNLITVNMSLGLRPAA